MLATYLSRFSNIADNKINCGPVLTWMEVSDYLFGDFCSDILLLLQKNVSFFILIKN